MDKYKLGLRSLLQESGSGDGRSSGGGGGGGPSSTSFHGPGYAPDHARILIRARPGRVVSLSTCSKLCLVSFAVGVVVGFTLKRRLKRWAGKLLRRLKED